MSGEVVTAVDSRTAAPPDFRPGALLALLLLCVYGGIAVSVDFPRTAMGIQSDEATYYMMGHSLAEDGDLTYRREDLVRVWKEFDSGPAGLFLKRGRDVRGGGLMMRPPFVWLRTDPDPVLLFDLTGPGAVEGLGLAGQQATRQRHVDDHPDAQVLRRG